MTFWYFDIFSKDEMITLLKDCLVQKDDGGYGYLRVLFNLKYSFENWNIFPLTFSASNIEFRAPLKATSRMDDGDEGVKELVDLTLK